MLTLDLVTLYNVSCFFRCKSFGFFNLAAITETRALYKLSGCNIKTLPTLQNGSQLHEDEIKKLRTNSGNERRNETQTQVTL